MTNAPHPPAPHHPPTTPPTSPTSPSGPREAGLDDDVVGTVPSLSSRVGARVFDELVMAIPHLIVAAPYFAVTTDRFELDAPKWVAIVAAVLPIVYDFVFVAVAGATPGKMLFGLGVRRAADGGRVAPYQAGLRAFAPAIGGVFALVATTEGWVSLFALVTPIVYASVTWDLRRRGLHDKAAGTIVLRTHL